MLRNDYTFYKNSRKWVKKVKEKYDVVYSYGLPPVSSLSAGNLYKKKNHVPHIAHLIELSPDDLLSRNYTFKYSLDYFVTLFSAKHYYRQPDELLISSPIYEEYLKKVLKLKKVNTTYVPNIPLIEEGIINPYQYKKGFNIVYYGDIDKLHILDRLPEAMDKVSRKDIYFHFFGKGKFSSELLEQIKQYGLTERLILHGDLPLNDVPNCFTNADACFLSLSDKGYLGKAINDKLIFMMAQKKPIIGVLEGDNAEVIKDSEGGLVIKDNVDDIVFAIQRMASFSKKELEIKGNNNYEYFLKHFSLNDVVADIESVLLKKGL